MEIDRRQIAVVGMKQVLRALDHDQLQTVYLASDADPALKSKIRAACDVHGAEVIPVNAMKELGRFCGIEVGAACAGVMRMEQA